MRQAIVHKGEDGRWVAEIPSLPGCVSQGRTRDEAIANVTEAAELWIDSVRALGKPVPPDDRSAEIALVPVAAA